MDVDMMMNITWACHISFDNPNPLTSKGLIALLGINVWEHAFSIFFLPSSGDLQELIIKKRQVFFNPSKCDTFCVFF
jgi:hypothetical protein